MKKNGRLLILGFILLSILSIFLYFNYLETQSGTGRIASETGYWLFLAAVVVFSVIYALQQPRDLPKKQLIYRLIILSLVLVLSLSLDMFLHYYARSAAHFQNSTAEILTGETGNLSLLEQTWQIYKLRFFTVLVIGALPFLWVGFIGKIKHSQIS